MAADPRRVKQVYLAACDVPEAERPALLSRECGEEAELRARVEELLAAREDAGTFLVASPEGAGPPVAATEYRAGDVIAGRYTLIQLIAEGGMGQVWVAQQSEPLKRRVALKLIKAGMDSRAVLQRFDTERQALALMDHPNIARVLDAGLSEHRRPFFVMELVDGPTLIKFCDEERLSIRQRLELFVLICQGVQHAHQKGIIHRDLKPANILVSRVDGRPTPKVIDFGVAKAVGFQLTDRTQDTHWGTVVGTLEYMSPEQAGSSDEGLDTRTDIYSLGVILYELLTGLRPIDSAMLKQAAMLEMLRLIQDEEPSKPSTRLSTSESLPSVAAARQIEPGRLTALLRGELDWVVMKCLEKPRDRRYETVSGLAHDIQRYLADEPVEARPASAAYRWGKVLRKHRALAAVSAALLLALVGGLVGTSIGLIRAEAARSAEQQQRGRAEVISEFMTATLRGAGPAVAKGRDRRLLKELMDDAAERLKSRPLDPEAEAELRRTLGEVYSSLGEWIAAEENYRRSLQLTQATHGPTDARTNDVELDLARCLLVAGNYDVSHALGSKVLGDCQRRGELSSERLAISHDVVAQAAYNRSGGDLVEAEKGHRRALEIRLATRPADDIANGRSRVLVAFILHKQQKSAEAEPLYRVGYEIHQKSLSRLHPETVSVACQYADCLIDLGRFDDSEALMLQTLKDAETLYGPVHAGVADVAWRIGNARSRQGDPQAAVKWHERCLEIRRQVFAGPHRDTASALSALASDKLKLGDAAGAETLHREVLAMRQAIFTSPSAVIAQTLQDLGDCERDQGRAADAGKTYTRSREMWRQVRPGGSEYAEVTNRLGVVQERLGQLDPAIESYREAFELRSQHLGPDHPEVVTIMANLGTAYFRKKMKPEAEEWTRRAVESVRKSGHPQTSLSLNCFGNLAFMMELNKNLAEAEGLFRDLVDRQRRVPGSERHPLPQALGGLADNLMKQGRPADAEPVWRECLALREKHQPGGWSTQVTRSQLGAALLAQEKFADAEVALRAAHDAMKPQVANMPASAQANFVTTIERLVRLNESTGNAAEADRWRGELAEFRKSPKGP